MVSLVSNSDNNSSRLTKKIPDFDRCYTIDLTNNLPTPAQVTLFGAFQFLFQFPTNPAPPTINIATIPVGLAPRDGAFNSINNRMYVTNGTSNSVSVIDCVTNTVIATVPVVGLSPRGIAFNPISNTMYVVSFAAGTVSVIDCVSNLVIGAPIVVGASPNGIAYNSISNRMYVCNSAAATVSVIDCATNTVIGVPIAVGAGVIRIAFNTTFNRMYVTNFTAGTVSVIDCVTNLVIGVPIVVGATPEGIAFNPIDNTMYLVRVGAGAVIIIDCITNLVVGAPIVVGALPFEIAYNSLNNTMYIPRQIANVVMVIDCNTNLITGAPIPVGAAPFGVEYNSINNSIYVQNTLGNTVSVIAPAGGAIPAGVTVGVSESTYQELLEETIWQPFIIGGMTIQSSVPQLAQINIIRYRDTNGVRQQYTFHPFDYFSVNQYQNFLEVFPIDIYVDGEMQSEFTLLGLTQVTITIYVKKRVAINNILHSEPIIEVGSDISPLFESRVTVTVPKK